jgi:hypothetical protein
MGRKEITMNIHNMQGVPEHLRDGLLRYLEHGIAPGHFLLAVLTNDLMEAVGRADPESAAGLVSLCSYLYNETPGLCHGSPEKVAAWIYAGGIKGQGRNREAVEPGVG